MKLRESGPRDERETGTNTVAQYSVSAIDWAEARPDDKHSENGLMHRLKEEVKE